MTVTLRSVDHVGDAALLTEWVGPERAHFWGMTGLTVDEVSEIYGYIDAQEHLTAEIILLDGEPVGLVQTYDPAVDEIGEWYPRRPGDLGIHLLLAPTPHRAGRTSQVMAAVIDDLFARGCARLVLEPDARNQASLDLFERLGAERGPLVELRTSIAEKPAQFLYLTPERSRTRID